MYERCCLGSPEDEPMVTDLAQCSVDPAYRTRTRFVSHRDLHGREDCTSMFVCQATPEGWVLTGAYSPDCRDKGEPPPPKIDPGLVAAGCAELEPLSPEQWYDREAYERARLRYRFGTAVREHCTVANWRLIQEEPLRLYTFFRRGGVPLSRVLVNVGAGDASWDDPLAAILDAFPDKADPWRGLYFEAVPGNCRKAKARLARRGKISLRCGYATPGEAADALCKELGHLGGGASACGSGASASGASAAAAAAAAASGRQLEASSAGSSPSSGEEARGGRGRRIEVDAMNLDIDSYDCSVLREVLLVASPKLLVIEVGGMVPPPIAVAAEFHPVFQQAERTNVSGAHAISGATARGVNEGFWQGCSLSAAIALLWPYGLGLYRYAMLNAMFVRKDVADAAGLAPLEGIEPKAQSGQRPPWEPADEFECWRRSCGEHPWGNLLRLTDQGVHTHLLPHVYGKVQDVKPRHPVSIAVASPPASTELPRPPDAPAAAWLSGPQGSDGLLTPGRGA